MGGAASEEQARRMASDWLMSAAGFCLGQGQSLDCPYGLPSIAHNDSAYKDQTYWRGRVWGPMNYLVYAGLSHPRYANVKEVTSARKALASSSLKLLLNEWLDKHHVHENYNAKTGAGYRT